MSPTLPPEATPPSLWQARRGLALLFWVAALNLFDRNILLVLQEPIRRDLQLTDLQLGALTGLSFALVYAMCSLPIARLADSVVRKWVIAASVGIWSLMTVFSGFVTSYAALVSLRMGVAFGEAGSVPASHSMIADMFPVHRRPSAYAVWALSNPLGSMLAYLIGGALLALLGWRYTLVAVGLGSLLVVPFLLTMKEPVRGAFDSDRTARTQMPLKGALKAIFGSRPMLLLLAGAGLNNYVMNALQSWTVPYYTRVFGLSIQELTASLALVIGLAGGIGAVMGGYLVQRLGRKNLGWYMKVPALATLAVIPLALFQFSTANVVLSLGVGFIATVAMITSPVCFVATSQLIMPPAVRATASAALVFTTNVVGLALGPTITGFISDTLSAGDYPPNEALRYAILASLLIAPVAAAILWKGAKDLQELPA